MSRSLVPKGVWEVWQGDRIVCSRQQKMTYQQAINKVENEARHGVIMRAVLAPPIQQAGAPKENSNAG